MTVIVRYFHLEFRNIWRKDSQSSKLKRKIHYFVLDGSNKGKTKHYQFKSKYSS